VEEWWEGDSIGQISMASSNFPLGMLDLSMICSILNLSLSYLKGVIVVVM
jgi:hypothetical protein